MKDLKDILISCIRDHNDTASMIFEEYAEDAQAGTSHFQNNFGDGSDGYILELLQIWKTIKNKPNSSDKHAYFT